jgi:hypothetical protein
VASKEKEHDWDREMREVDKLLAKLPEADPTLGRGVPTVPKTARVSSPGAMGPTTGSTGISAFATWFRVGLGVVLGIGMLVWPYSHVCGAKLMFYLIGASTVVVAGAWGGISSWRRRLGLAHILSLGVLLWGLALVAGVVLPRAGYSNPPALWFCPEPPVQITPRR